MLWLLLLAALLASLTVDSARLFLLSSIALLFRLFPWATLSSIGVVIAWALKSIWR